MTEDEAIETYSFVHLPTDFFQSTLDTLYDLCYRRGILSSMFTFEHYARVSDYADWLTPRKEEITEHRSMGGEE